MSIRLLIAGNDARQQLIGMTVESNAYDVVGIARDGQETIEMAMQFHPDVALISYNLPGISGPQTCEMLNAISPGICSVLLVEGKTPERMDLALRAGARALVAKPLDPIQFDALLGQLSEIKRRRESDEFRRWEDPSLFPKIITVTGAKGGVGKTSIAVNLAVKLAKDLPNKVAIVDLCTQFGDVATMLNVMPRFTIVDMMQHSKEPELDLVQSYMTKHASGVHVLVAANSPVSYDAIGGDFLENLLYMLKRMYRYVIIDVPPILHNGSLRVLSNSNLVLLVASLSDLTTIADTKKFHDTLAAENVSTENIKVVLNRVSKSNAVQVADIGKMLSCSVIAQIPEELRIVTAINQGVPMSSKDSDSPYCQGITNLAETIMGVTPNISKPKRFAAMFAGLVSGTLGIR